MFIVQRLFYFFPYYSYLPNLDLAFEFDIFYFQSKCEIRLFFYSLHC